jgi:prepilin-type N-terminal cleavage/methylation domain-containing protein
MKKTDSGFSLVELLVVLLMMGLLMALAIPSFLGIKKPLRQSVESIKAQINLIALKSRATGKAYRMVPSSPKQLKIQSGANCDIPTSQWNEQSNLTIDLSENTALSDTPLPIYDNPTTISTAPQYLDWSICFDRQGRVAKATTFTVKDIRGDNRARTARIEMNKVGIDSISTFDVSGGKIPELDGELQY